MYIGEVTVRRIDRHRNKHVALLIGGNRPDRCLFTGRSRKNTYGLVNHVEDYIRDPEAIRMVKKKVQWIDVLHEHSANSGRRTNGNPLEASRLQNFALDPFPLSVDRRSMLRITCSLPLTNEILKRLEPAYPLVRCHLRIPISTPQGPPSDMSSSLAPELAPD